MRARRLSEIAAAIGGRVLGDDVEVSSVVVDSRRVNSGSLFFALRGERYDAHEFVPDAFANGADAAVVRRPDAAGGGGSVIVVPDVGEALLALAAGERGAMEALVIAVTGANGKTSTKDMAAAVLGTRHPLFASPASFNNEVGVPLTILGAPPGIEVLVCELGARRVGDHRRLCQVAAPEVVVVTNAGVAHMEIFGSWENIVRATAEPVEFLGTGGLAVLCADDPVVSALASETKARVSTFGTSSRADVRAEGVTLSREGRASFTLVSGDEHEPVDLAVPGEHMVQNALAAAACGIALGLSAAECATGLKEAGVSAWRMESFVTPGGIRVLNDAYNANPDSMAAGLKSARWIGRDARVVAVLGHMAELGPISKEEHERVGRLVARLGIDRLVTVGAQAEPIGRAAVLDGLELEKVEGCATVDEALERVRAWARRDDVVFLKGSRVAGLERLAEAMR